METLLREKKKSGGIERSWVCAVTQEERDRHEHRTQDMSAGVSVKDHWGPLAKWLSIIEQIRRAMNPAKDLPTHPCLGRLGSSLRFGQPPHGTANALLFRQLPLSFIPATAKGQKLQRGNLTVFSDFLCGGVKNSEPENADDRIIGYWRAPRAAATVWTDRKFSVSAWCQHWSALPTEGNILPVQGQVRDTIPLQTWSREVADLSNQEMPAAFLAGAIILLWR